MTDKKKKKGEVHIDLQKSFGKKQKRSLKFQDIVCMFEVLVEERAAADVCGSWNPNTQSAS